MSHIWLETDLEPDDLVAIYVLHKKGFIFDYVVVGEGNSEIKAKRMRKYLTMLGSDKTIIRGYGSSKIFQFDGDEFNESGECDKDTHVELPTDSMKHLEDYEELLNKYINETDNPIIVSFKPMRELRLYEGDNLNKVELFVYGSFNFRCLNKTKLKLPSVHDTLMRFKKVNIFETYYAIEQKSIFDTDTTPDAIDKLFMSNSIFLKFTKKVMELWNRDIVDDCLSTCQKVIYDYNINKTHNIDLVYDSNLDGILFGDNDDKTRKFLIENNVSSNDIEMFLRNKKVYKSASKYGAKQFVAADVGLALVMMSNVLPTKVVLSFDSNGYTQTKKVDDSESISNIYMYFGTNMKYLEEELCKCL